MGVLCPIAAQGYDLGARLKLVRLRNSARFWDPGVMLRALQRVDVGLCVYLVVRLQEHVGGMEVPSHFRIRPLILA